jgi:hypothetical protein
MTQLYLLNLAQLLHLYMPYLTSIIADSDLVIYNLPKIDRLPQQLFDSLISVNGSLTLYFCGGLGNEVPVYDWVFSKLTTVQGLLQIGSDYNYPTYQITSLEFPVLTYAGGITLSVRLYVTSPPFSPSLHNLCPI